MPLNLFTYEHINDVLKNTFKCSKSEFLFSTKKCNYNENVTLLNVNCDDNKQQYVLMKIPEKLKSEKQQPLKNSKVLYPVFIIEDNNKQTYGAFEAEYNIQGLTTPKKNDIECLKIILKDLAEQQARELTSSTIKEKPSEYDLKKLTDNVISLDYFRDLDQSLIKKTLDDLQVAFEELFDNPNLIVTSIACPLAKNVYINQNANTSIFLQTCLNEAIPPVYDALLYILALSDQKFRQEHFENLISFYFQSIKMFLKKLQSSIADNINRSYREHQVRVLLPVVKFQITNFLLSLKNSEKLQEMLTNILYYFKFSLINQEDIFEIIKNKVESVDYDLLGYNLKSLSEQNGHLGEYFHLYIKINFQGLDIELHLFAKFLITSTELVKKIVENGPAKKEDFFYQTIIPLYRKYKLDNLLDYVPKCYLSRIGWLLVLDDLSREGYVTFKPNTVLNYEQYKVNIENLAKFHACSIILEEILSEESGKLYRLDKDYGEFFQESLMIFEEGNPLKSFLDGTWKALYHCFGKFPEITGNLNVPVEENKSTIKKVFLSLFSRIKKSDTVRNVINHGDMYAANMLLKFGEDKIITNGILIDYQLLRYTSPVYELLFFLFVSSTKETRNNHMNTLIEDYYRYFSENLRKFNVDPEAVFPRKSFNENMKFIKPAAVIGAFHYCRTTHLDSDLRDEMFHDQEKSDYYLQYHADELTDLSWNNEHYRNIIRGLIEDIVDIIKTDF